jgi:hypothetical protein
MNKQQHSKPQSNTTNKMALEWEGASFGQQFRDMFEKGTNFESMTTDEVSRHAVEILADSHNEPEWQVIQFHQHTLERIVNTRRQLQFLEACFNLAQMPFNEDTRDNRCVVRHGAIRVTEHKTEIVEKEYFYGSCGRCYSSGPLGKICQRCTNQSRFDRIYAEGHKNPGMTVHRCVIAGTSVMVMYDDEDHPENGNYTNGLRTGMYDPSNFIYRSQGSELFGFDSECMVSNLGSAMGCSDKKVKEVLRNMGFELDTEEEE